MTGWLSRRAILAWPLTLAGSPAAAQEAEPDRGIGGTGVVPTEAEDRGIGGTGVIGTIQRFGSIYVNDLRIAYPRNVAVLIDDRKALVWDLKLGHVVSVVAEPGRGGLTTHQIDVTSEVVGPIEAVDRKALVVLGQTVVPRRHVSGSRWVVGDFVAVHGLRRRDGTIVASLIEQRAAGLLRISGPARTSDDGVTMIGSLPVYDADGRLAGRRVSLTGRLIGGVFHPVGRERTPRRRPARFSIEGYVSSAEGALRLGSGITVQSGDLAMPDGDDARAVVTAEVAPDGGLMLAEVHFIGDRLGGSLTGPGTRPGPAHSGSPDPGTGPGQHSPGTLDRRGMGPHGELGGGGVSPGARGGVGPGRGRGIR